MTGGPIRVTADDRSGAMETAALLADLGLRTWVRSWDGDDVTDAAPECVVTDIRTRHLAAHAAAERAQRVAASGTVRAHKMDSTLRGNWADEVVALRGDRGVLLVPAYPSAGRTCVAGEVLVHGVPVAHSEFADDPRHPVRSSRPADALRALGEQHVIEAPTPEAVARWAGAGAPGVCVADARTDDEVQSCVEACLRALSPGREVLVAGTARTVSAVGPRRRPRSTPALPVGDVLVVCGSRHPVSRAQASLAEELPGVTVQYPPADLRADAEIVALELAVRAHDHVHARRPALVVLLGGDTTDAFIGERAVRVVGSVATGVALGEVLVGSAPLTVLTKPGGFGHDRLLVDVLAGRRTA